VSVDNLFDIRHTAVAKFKVVVVEYLVKFAVSWENVFLTKLKKNLPMLMVRFLSNGGLNHIILRFRLSTLRFRLG